MSKSSALMRSVKRYQKELGLALVEIPKGSKGPSRRGWTKGNGVSWKKWKNGCEGWNCGVLHHQSRTICLDIDDLSGVRDRYPIIERIIDEALAGKCGLVWSSGVENRLKILFKIDKEFWKKMRVITFPSGLGQVRGGKDCGLQDVILGVHPSGSEYKELSCSSNLEIPKWFKKVLLQELTSSATACKGSAGGGTGYVFVDVFNKWYMNLRDVFSVSSGAVLTGDLLEDVLSWSNGGYERIPGRLLSLLRIGSNNKLSVQLYRDPDGIDRVFNFSDTPAKELDVAGARLLAAGLHDPYSLLSSILGFDEARRYVCTDNAELAALVTTANSNSEAAKLAETIASDSSAVEMFRMEGIVFGTGAAPYLDSSIKFPKELCRGFAALVDSMCWHQQGVYNPDMAFWYSLVLADWLIGGGYNSIGGTDCEPLYVFTAGPSGMGKSVTMKAGNVHIRELGGSGKVASDVIGCLGDGELVGGGVGGRKAADEKRASTVSVAFLNKRHIKNVKTAEGLEDMLTSGAPFEAGGLDHGCDLLFTQDEYGLRENGVMDNSARLFRATILDYKTLSRMDHVEPRLLAAPKGSGSGSGSGSGFGLKKVNRYCVHFNYFTTATNATLRGVIGDSEIGSGYLQRFIGGTGEANWKTRKSVYGSRSWSVSRLGSGGWKGKKLLRLLKAVLRVSNSVRGLGRVRGGVVVSVDSLALDYLDRLFEICITGVGSEPLVGKMVENIYPLAKLIAIFRSPEAPVVTVLDIKWAHTICTCSVLYFKWLLKELTYVDNEMAVEKAVRRWLNTKLADERWVSSMEKGYVSHRDLVRGAGLGKFGAAIYNPVLVGLQDDGLYEIIEVHGKLKNGQKRKTLRILLSNNV